MTLGPVGEKQREPGCTCRNLKAGVCRCTCHRCGSKRLQWQAWGSYLDKDLRCLMCGYLVDVWNC